MAISDSEYRRKNKYTNKEDRRAPKTSPESLIEDEEDYEEFVRSMERKNSGRRNASYNRDSSRGASYDRSGSSRASVDDSRRRASSGRNQGSGGLRQAGDISEGRRDPGAKDRRAGGAGRPEYDDREGIRIDGSRGQGKPPKKRKKRGFLGILIGILVFLLIAAGAVGGYVFYKMHDVLKLQQVDSVDLEEQLRQGIPYKVRSDEHLNGYRNIALFGVDSRSGDLLGGDNRSDTMMICSINEKSGEVRLVSVYRDTLLEVAENDYRKANAAYALGGPAQAIDMINKNLDMNIVDFVTVGFEGLAHTIDALGGIEIEIDEEERSYLNQYVHDMHIELGTEDTPVEKSGLVTLTGIQATAYSRIRYTAGDDFRRAERQRTVLSKTLEKAKAASPATLVKVADNVVGDMATSLSSSEILSLIMMAGKAELADTAGIPLEEYREFRSSVDEGDFVLPRTLESNVIWLHKFLFNDTGYQLSEEAAARNTAIQEYADKYSWSVY